MATAGSRPTLSLEIRRTLRQPPEKVYAAWTKAEALSRWFAPSDQYQVVVTALDVRPGGAWGLEMRHSGGNVHPVSGKYVTVEPPSTLAFTWFWASRPEFGEMLVTVKFLAAAAGGTELVITHERLLDEVSRTAHRDGWNACLARLDSAI